MSQFTKTEVLQSDAGKILVGDMKDKQVVAEEIVNSPDYNNLVYLDDAGYSGTQVVNWLYGVLDVLLQSASDGALDKRQIDIHLVLPFVTKSALSKINDFFADKVGAQKSIKLNFHYSRSMFSVNDALSKITDVEKRERLKKLILKLFDVYEDESVLELPLTYFQHKVPDWMSVPTTFQEGSEGYARVFDGPVFGEDGKIKELFPLIPPLDTAPYQPNYYSEVNEIRKNPDWSNRVDGQSVETPGFRSEARSLDSGQARELTVAEQQVGENVISFFQSPENYSAEEINQLADRISLLGEQSRLSSFISVLRSIAELKSIPVNSEKGVAEGVDANRANYASQVLLGRLMASKLERLINPPTIAFDAEVSEATLLDLAGKISPEFAQLIGAIQLRSVADLRKLFKDKGVTVMNINPKLADAAAVDASSELLSQLGLPMVGVVIDGQSNSFVDSTRIMLQIMIAVFIASRKDLQDKLKDGKAEEVKAEISLMLFQVGDQPAEGVLQFKNGRLEIVQSQLAQFIETLFKAQTAVAVAA